MLHEPAESAFKGMNNLAERQEGLEDFPLVKTNWQRTSSLPFVKTWKKKRPAFGGL